MSDEKITQFIGTLQAKAVAAASSPAGFSFSDALTLLQKAAYGIVGYLASSKSGLDPASLEAAAVGYLQTVYTTVLAPIAIANIPGGAILAPMLQTIFISTATSAVHTAIGLVFHTSAVAAAGPGAPAFSVASALIDVGNS